MGQNQAGSCHTERQHAEGGKEVEEEERVRRVEGRGPGWRYEAERGLTVWRTPT